MVHNRHGLAAIDHIVVLMLENRSFDHVLGYLYRDTGNLTEIGLDFDGLNGDESNPAPDGGVVRVFPIEPDTPNAYLMPGANPGEGFLAANNQIPSLTARDQSVYGLGDVLELREPRDDDPLAGIAVPSATGREPSAGETSHLQRLHADLVSRTLPPGTPPPPADASSDQLITYVLRHAAATG